MLFRMQRPSLLDHKYWEFNKRFVHSGIIVATSIIIPLLESCVHREIVGFLAVSAVGEDPRTDDG